MFTPPASVPHESGVDPAATGDLDVEEFRRAAHRAVEWMADYLRDIDSYPVLAQVAPGEVRASLPAGPPASGEGMDTVLDDVERLIIPGVTHWNHPGFFAYFSVSASAPGIIGEMLAAVLNVNGMLWRTSPSATELEEVALGWLRQMLGLDDEWFGLITDTASISTLLAIAAAREARAELQIRERGLAGRSDLPALRVYCSSQAHSSVDKAAITLGLGLENVVRIPVDTEFRMRPDLLEETIAADVARGFIPLACVATVGTTSTTSVDPVPAIAELCAAHGLWLHVDAAYGGAMAVVPEFRGVFAGVDRADSMVVNPHKWLFTPIDCSALYTRRPEVLRRAFALVPAYLTTADGGATNLMDYGVQLGRRFRALKLWMVLRGFGSDGIAARIRAHVALADALASWIRAEPEWEVVAPVPMSTVCFRHTPAGLSDVECDALNERLITQVNASGRVFVSHTVLDERYVIRLAIGNIRTEERHVAEAWRLLCEAADAERSA